MMTITEAGELFSKEYNHIKLKMYLISDIPILIPKVLVGTYRKSKDITDQEINLGDLVCFQVPSWGRSKPTLGTGIVVGFAGGSYRVVKFGKNGLLESRVYTPYPVAIIKRNKETNWEGSSVV